MKADYTALDAAITDKITALQPIMFGTLTALVAVESKALAHTDRQHQAWRVVDRRLQFLRKAKKIRYQRKPEGWVLVAA